MALTPEQIDLLRLLAPDALPRAAPAGDVGAGPPAQAPGAAPPAFGLTVGSGVRAPGAPPPPAAPPPPVRPAPASADVLQLPGVTGPRQTFPVAPGQRPISVQRRADGKPVLTAPPPPITDITFSGGGGKGAALPGAVRAMQDAHVLDQVHKVSGASVGSMTAAMIAAGMTADEFEAAANDPRTSAAIMEGHSSLAIKAGTAGGLLGLSDAPLSGEGLQSLVRKVMNETLRKRLTEYLQAHQPPAEPADPQVLEVLHRISSDEQGATFLDMRKLAAIIPAIKEVVITGTFVDASSDDGKEAPLSPADAVVGMVPPGAKVLPRGKPAPGAKAPPAQAKLYVFDADSEPQLAVSLAVQASAAFPGAFKPVFLTLASGVKAKFIDGGVLNNTPTASTLGQDRKLDPMPQQRAMTFVFEDGDGAVDQLLAGKVKPSVGKAAQIKDWVVGAPNAAADYATARDLADSPEQIVKVPLKFTATVGGKATKLDYTGTASGTLNFDMSVDEKKTLQSKTRDATDAQISREAADRSQTFESDEDMFMAVPLADLQAMVQGGYPKAAEALQFRQQVDSQLQALRKLQDDMQSVPLDKAAGQLGQLADVLDGLRSAGDGAPARQDYVARELNRGALDGLVGDLRELMSQGSAKPEDVQRLRANPMCQATLDTRALVELRMHVRSLETNLIYPYMKKQTEGGTGLQTLITMDERLRAATTAAQVNQALDLGIRHFAKKRDLPPKTGHAAFAEALRDNLMAS